MENALKLALERREFQIHYQPRVALSDSRIIGVEALLRWSRPEFGNVSPAEFVPIMETSGLIEEVGTWVLREACAQMRPLFELHDELRVSINVSARQFHGGQLAAVVAQAMEAAGVSPSRVEIEITEGVLITQTHEAAKTLRTLKGMGVNISLDDFGSGYSSLGYLKQFPIDCLKIDRSFIMDLPGRNDSKVIVEAILGLASSLDLRVTAEGIESAEQLAFLRTRGCQEGQGYLFARPMPLDDLIHKLSSSIYT
jgi:EAL domain-containing protein (putative c-di-GMP-specific phosphodiesterase class I)